jgi:hypothetical protein
MKSLMLSSSTSTKSNSHGRPGKVLDTSRFGSPHQTQFRGFRGAN